MKRVALSLRQPWAWAVIHAGKNIENRTWPTRFRGEFLIHAAKGMTAAEYEGTRDFIQRVAGLTVAGRVPARAALERGGIIGKARLVDVLKPCAWECFHKPESFACPETHPAWHMTEQHGFVLTDVVALPFEPCVGRLGFFDPDAKGASWKGGFR